MNDAIPPMCLFLHLSGFKIGCSDEFHDINGRTYKVRNWFLSKLQLLVIIFGNILARDSSAFTDISSYFLIIFFSNSSPPFIVSFFTTEQNMLLTGTDRNMD